jgi:hypothetical protein
MVGLAIGGDLVRVRGNHQSAERAGDGFRPVHPGDVEPEQMALQVDAYGRRDGGKLGHVSSPDRQVAHVTVPDGSLSDLGPIVGQPPEAAGREPL